MANDIRRPFGGFGGQGAHGTRARNRTMIVGSEQAGQMRASVFEDEDRDNKPQELLPNSFDQREPSGQLSPTESTDYQRVTSMIGDEESLQALEDIFDIPGEPAYQPPQQARAEEPVSYEPEMNSTPSVSDAVDPNREIIQPKSISVSRIVKVGSFVPPSSESQWSEQSADTLHNLSNNESYQKEYDEVAPVSEKLASENNARHVEREESDPMDAQYDEIFWKSDSPLVGFLVSYDHDPKGAYVELRTGRLIVSSQREESGSCFVVSDPSVSPMHAIMRVANNSVQVLDQLSEAGTRVKRGGSQEEIFLSGEKSSLSHGDIVFFGDRKFYVLLVMRDDG